MEKQGVRGMAVHQTRLTGKAGEHIVAGQLMLRGMNVSFPAVDDGVDIIAANGCRIQIKTAHLRFTPSVLKLSPGYREGIFTFHFANRKFIATSQNKIRRIEKRQFHEFCDVVVLYGIEQNRFWIAPAKILEGTQALFMGPKNARAFEKDMPEMQAMVDMGISQKDIGEHFGISQFAVWNRLQKAGTQRDGNSIRCAVRNCEDAWEHILEFGQRETQIEPTGSEQPQLSPFEGKEN